MIYFHHLSNISRDLEVSSINFFPSHFRLKKLFYNLLTSVNEATSAT